MRSESVITMSDVRNAAGFRVQPAHCEHHGDFEQRVTMLMGREIVGRCPECEKAAIAERQAKQQAEETRLKREAMTRKLGSALIPKRDRKSVV